jgi:hypothetical protein
METRFSWLTNVSELEGLVEGFRWAFYAGAVLTGSVRVGIAEELSRTELERDVGAFSRRSQAHGAGGHGRT